MKIFVSMAFVLLLAGTASHSHATQITEKGKTMSAKGSFEVKLVPQKEDVAPVGRMVIDKTYLGDIKGTGIGQMISKRTEGGTAVYFAIEEFSGTVNGKSGTFTLIHKGYLSKESQMLEVEVLGGSGSGDLVGISGSMTIVQDAEGHTYEFKYEL